MAASQVNANDSFANLKFKAPRIKSSKLDAAHKWLIVLIAVIIFIMLIGIIGFIIGKSIKAFSVYGFFKFLFTSNWVPEFNQFGIGGFILSTMMLLLIALLISIPLTIFSSLFIVEYLSSRGRKIITTIIEILAGIPSVVFGLFAINQIGPITQLLGANSAGNMMTAGVTLAFMALPTMIALSINGLNAVPQSYRYAALGLGMTKQQTTFKIVLWSAWPRIVSAILMGMTRIIGETMAVILIAGNATKGLIVGEGFDNFIFSSIRTLSATIGLEMLENHGANHESALYAIGLVLFVLVTIINLFFLGISSLSSKDKRNAPIKIKTKKLNYSVIYTDNDLTSLIKIYTQKRILKNIFTYIFNFILFISTLIVIVFTLWILGIVIIDGFVGFSFDAFINIEGQKSGIFATMLVSILLVISTIVVAIPLALIAAIFLNQYLNKNSFFYKGIKFFLSILSSTPSIVYGAFGLTFFIYYLRIPMSIFASSLTMALLVLPSMIFIFEDAMNSVPNSYLEAAIGMGLSKTKTIWKILVPCAIKAMLTGTILTIGRIIGESAPVYLTLGTSVRMPSEGFLGSGANLTTEIYLLTSEGSSPETINLAYQMALITIIIILLMNWFSRFLSTRLDPLYSKVTLKEKIAQLKSNFHNFSFKKTFTGIHHFIKVYVNKTTTYLKPSNIKSRWKLHYKRNQLIKSILKVKGEKSNEKG